MALLMGPCFWKVEFKNVISVNNITIQLQFRKQENDLLTYPLCPHHTCALRLDVTAEHSRSGEFGPVAPVLSGHTSQVLEARRSVVGPG